MERLVAGDKARRDLVVARLNQMPGVTCETPEAYWGVAPHPDEKS